MPIVAALLVRQHRLQRGLFATFVHTLSLPPPSTTKPYMNIISVFSKTIFQTEGIVAATLTPPTTTNSINDLALAFPMVSCPSTTPSRESLSKFRVLGKNRCSSGQLSPPCKRPASGLGLPKRCLNPREPQDLLHNGFWVACQSLTNSTVGSCETSPIHCEEVQTAKY